MDLCMTQMPINLSNLFGIPEHLTKKSSSGVEVRFTSFPRHVCLVNNRTSIEVRTFLEVQNTRTSIGSRTDR